MTNEESRGDTISCVMNEVNLPSGTRSPISLPPILEPIRDLKKKYKIQSMCFLSYLCKSKSCLLSQLSLLIWCWVPVVFVALLQGVPGLLLEAVHGLLSVPDCPGQRVFPSESVLVHGAWGHKYNSSFQLTKLTFWQRSRLLGHTKSSSDLFVQMFGSFSGRA